VDNQKIISPTNIKEIWMMAGLGKVDVACIGFMAFVILATSGYMAVFQGWVVVDGAQIWVGWTWWIVFGIVIVSLFVIFVSSRWKPG
jgi:hypothetical protein